MVATFNKTIRKHVFLHPVDKKRRYAALKAALLKDKRKYSDRLEGALLDVKNLKVVGERHLVVEGYTSMEVEADCVVFIPRPGQILEGVINKQSFSHLGCLVMSIFNASLSVPSSQDLVPQLGDLVSFVVTEVIVDGEILFMRGTLESIISHSAPAKNVSATEKPKEETPHPSDNPIEMEECTFSISDIKSEVKTPEKIVCKAEILSPEKDSPSKSKKKKKKKKERQAT